MALSYQQQHAQQDTILIRLSQCLVDVSIDVIAEDPATPSHDERKRMANVFLINPESGLLVKNFARGVMTNANAGTGVDDPMIDDDALKFVVASLWNAYAGVT